MRLIQRWRGRLSGLVSALVLGSSLAVVGVVSGAAPAAAASPACPSWGTVIKNDSPQSGYYFNQFMYGGLTPPDIPSPYYTSYKLVPNLPFSSQAAYWGVEKGGFKAAGWTCGSDQYGRSTSIVYAAVPIIPGGHQRSNVKTRCYFEIYSDVVLYQNTFNKGGIQLSEELSYALKLGTSEPFWVAQELSIEFTASFKKTWTYKLDEPGRLTVYPRVERCFFDTWETARNGSYAKVGNGFIDRPIGFTEAVDPL